MLDYAIVQFKLWVIGFIWENYWSFWPWAWDHPVQAIFIFWVTFIAYGTLRRAWEDGSLKALHWTQQAMILVPTIAPMLHAYLADVFILRWIYGWITFRVKPWQQTWNPFNPGMTFSRLVALMKERPSNGRFFFLDNGRHARWWSPILHTIDPYGH